MKKAAVIAGLSMKSAYERLHPGVRQCDLIADIGTAQIRGKPEFGAD